MSIGAGLRRGGVMIGHWVYPPVCAGCGVLVGEHGGVCGTCWSNLRQIERPCCDVMGTPFSHDMGGALVSAEAIADPPPFRRARAAVLYDDVARSIVHRLKYKDRTDLATIMARWMVRAGDELIAESECVVSVPLHRRRFMARRYNQSAELARILARRSALPYLPGALGRRKSTRPQVGLTAKARVENMRGAFSVPQTAQSDIIGRSVLLVDDVYTTGATVKAASHTLLKAGAGSVSVLTFARVSPDFG
ncbi:MAG: ComF family protein [Alphaproteobacteria bacterium]|nr:ComF family protein [Alphaproteobacteria bacterium]